MIPALAQAALDPALRGRTMQVYVYLTGALDVYQWRPIKIAQSAHAMKLRRGHISRALTILIARGYVEAKRDEEDERRRMFRLVYSVSSVVRNPAA